MSKKLSITDILIIIFALVLSIALFYNAQSNTSNTVKIQCNGTTYLYNLDTDRDIHLTGAIGDVLIRIEDSRVWIIESSCKNKICLKMKKVDKNGGFIACIPNKVLITVETKDEVVIDDISR